MNKISVIVPVYNAKEYLLQCVRSILAGTHENLEVILVDDGSTDGSLDLVNELASQDERIIVLSKAHSGALNSRLAGVKAATGDWIGFVDVDDTILPKMYERLLENAMRYNTEISFCGMQMVNENGVVHGEASIGEIETWSRDEGLVALIEDKERKLLFSSSCNKLYRKILFSDDVYCKLEREQLNCNEDFLMNYFLFKKAGRLVYEDISYYRYHLQKGSATRAIPISTFIPDAIRVREIIKDDAASDINVFPSAIRTYLLTLMECYSILRRQKSQEEKDVAKIREKLALEKQHFHLLGKGQEETARLIVESPELFAMISDERHRSKAQA